MRSRSIGFTKAAAPALAAGGLPPLISSSPRDHAQPRLDGQPLEQAADLSARGCKVQQDEAGPQRGQHLVGLRASVRGHDQVTLSLQPRRQRAPRPVSPGSEGVLRIVGEQLALGQV
jgi:hypothetical protein